MKKPRNISGAGVIKRMHYRETLIEPNFCDMSLRADFRVLSSSSENCAALPFTVLPFSLWASQLRDLPKYFFAIYAMETIFVISPILSAMVRFSTSFAVVLTNDSRASVNSLGFSFFRASISRAMPCFSSSVFAALFLAASACILSFISYSNNTAKEINFC